MGIVRNMEFVNNVWLKIVNSAMKLSKAAMNAI